VRIAVLLSILAIVSTTQPACARLQALAAWGVFSGGNFAGCLFAEVGYSQIPKVNLVPLGQLFVTIGGRF